MNWALPDGIRVLYLTFVWDETLILAIYRDRADITMPYTHRLQEGRVGPLMYAMEQSLTHEEKRTMFWNCVSSGQIENVV